MDFFLKLIAPLENYDFSNFLHNLVLALPASVLAGVIIFLLLLAFKKLKSRNARHAGESGIQSGLRLPKSHAPNFAAQARAY